MITTPTILTRRHFSQLLAATAAATLFGQKAPASRLNDIAHVPFSAEGGLINTFHVSGRQWRKIQSIRSRNPTHLEPHPTLPILYAVHDLPLWDHLPRGAVSAYAIAPEGHLTYLNTQPLSLAATNPRHAAITPDGTCLAVASFQAGIYNILPLAHDGILQPPSIIRKDLSLSVDRNVSPHFLQFHPDSKSLHTMDSRYHPINSLKIEGDFLVPIAVRTGTKLPETSTPIRRSIVVWNDSSSSFLFRRV